MRVLHVQPEMLHDVSYQNADTSVLTLAALAPPSLLTSQLRHTSTLALVNTSPTPGYCDGEGHLQYQNLSSTYNI